MARYEYQVVPAPSKGTKAKGIKAPEARFSLTLQDLMNDMGAKGWEYQRAETLPSEERKGLTGSSTNWRHVLIFRRPLEDAVAAPVAEAPQPAETKPEPAQKPTEFTSAPRPVEPPAPPAMKPAAPSPVPAPRVARPDMAGHPKARASWAPEPTDTPKPAPGINPLAAPRKNPENSDV